MCSLCCACCSCLADHARLCIRPGRHVLPPDAGGQELRRGPQPPAARRDERALLNGAGGRWRRGVAAGRIDADVRAGRIRHPLRLKDLGACASYLAASGSLSPALSPTSVQDALWLSRRLSPSEQGLSLWLSGSLARRTCLSKGLCAAAPRAAGAERQRRGPHRHPQRRHATLHRTPHDHCRDRLGCILPKSASSDLGCILPKSAKQ